MPEQKLDEQSKMASLIEKGFPRQGAFLWSKRHRQLLVSCRLFGSLLTAFALMLIGLALSRNKTGSRPGAETVRDPRLLDILHSTFYLTVISSFVLASCAAFLLLRIHRAKPARFARMYFEDLALMWCVHVFLTLAVLCLAQILGGHLLMDLLIIMCLITIARSVHLSVYSFYLTQRKIVIRHLRHRRQERLADLLLKTGSPVQLSISTSWRKAHFRFFGDFGVCLFEIWFRKGDAKEVVEVCQRHWPSLRVEHP